MVAVMSGVGLEGAGVQAASKMMNMLRAIRVRIFNGFSFYMPG